MMYKIVEKTIFPKIGEHVSVDLDPTGLTDLIFSDFLNSGFDGGSAKITIEDIGDIRVRPIYLT